MANKAEELIKALKKLMNFDSATPAVYALADGTAVQISKFEAGGILTISDAPAAAGSYTLQDGSSLTIGEAGVITAIAQGADPAAGAQQLESHTLADGSTIDVSSLEVGGAVTINGAMAPAATYVLADGSSLVVDATGNITEILPKADEQPADLSTPEQMNAATESFATGTADERLAKLEQVFKAFMNYSFGLQKAALEQKTASDQVIATYQQKLAAAEATIANQKEINGQVLDLVEELAKAPSADPPAQRSVSSFSKVEPKNKALARMADAAKKISEEQKN